MLKINSIQMNYFNVNDPSKTVTILKDEGGFMHLSDGVMVKKDTFLSKYQPSLGVETPVNESVQTQTNVPQPQTSGEIDPATFFNNSAVSTFTEDFKKADVNKIGTDQEAIVRQAGVPQQQTNTQQPHNPQQGSSDGIVQVQRDPEMEKIEQMFENEKYAFGEEEANKRRLGRIATHQGIGAKPKQPYTPDGNTEQPQGDVNTQQSQPPQKPIDPSELMFKSFKRNFDIDINIAFKDKIANPDFVKMMMENMEGDIIGYYKNLVMNNIMANVNVIEAEVEKSIEFAIYGEDYVKPNPTEIDIDDDGINGVDEEDKIVLDKKVKKDNIIPNHSNKYVDGDGQICNVSMSGVRTYGGDAVKGKTTSSGKQTYKFDNGKGKIVDLLPKSAKKKGYKPYVGTDESK